MDFGSDSPLSLLWTISAFVAFVCFCSRNYGLTGGARTGTEFEQKVAKVTKGGAEDENGGRLMMAGGAFETEGLLDPPGCFFIWPGTSGCSTRDGGLDLAAHFEGGRKVVLEFRRCESNSSLPSAGGAEAVVVVTVRRLIPVTVRRAHVRRLIVERAAPKQAIEWPPPAGRACYGTSLPVVDRCLRGGRGDPTHDSGTDVGERETTVGEGSLHPAHPAAEAPDIFLGEQAVSREDAVAEKANAVASGKYDTLIVVDTQTESLEELADLSAHFVDASLVVGENQEVVDVAHVAEPQTVGDEVVERVEVNVGEELAGLVSQGQAAPCARLV